MQNGALQGTDLVVQVIEDAGRGHLLEELVPADILKSSAVCSRPLAALHQDGSRCAIQQRCNGDQPKEIDAIDVLQSHHRQAISNSQAVHCGFHCIYLKAVVTATEYVHLVVSQSLLGIDISEHHAHVGQHGVVEAIPCKADFLHG